MALSKERTGEIALALLQNQLEEDGDLILQPKEVRRNIMNKAKKYGVKPSEFAEFVKERLEIAYRKTLAKLESIKDEEEADTDD